MSRHWALFLLPLSIAACGPAGTADSSDRKSAPEVVARTGAPARVDELKPNFDWPQWQGPNRDTISKEKGLLKSWPKEGPPLAWRITGLGQGYSTPTIADGRVFTMGNRDKTEYVYALAEDGGKELWATATGPVRANGGGYPGPRCSPTVDGSLVYALGLNGDLLCLDAASGKEHWRKDLRKDFGGQVGGWGYSESPLVDGDRLIVTPGGKKATLLALDKKSGSTVWQGVVPSGEGAHYSSVIAANVNGQRQYIQFLSRGVVGMNADDGKFLWRYDRPPTALPTARRRSITTAWSSPLPTMGSAAAP